MQRKLRDRGSAHLIPLVRPHAYNRTTRLVAKDFWDYEIDVPALAEGGGLRRSPRVFIVYVVGNLLTVGVGRVDEGRCQVLDFGVEAENGGVDGREENGRKDD